MRATATVAGEMAKIHRTAKMATLNSVGKYQVSN